MYMYWCYVVLVRLWSVCEVVIVPYVEAVVAETVMCELFVLHVCKLRECEGVSVTEILLWGIDEVCLW